MDMIPLQGEQQNPWETTNPISLSAQLVGPFYFRSVSFHSVPFHPVLAIIHISSPYLSSHALALKRR
jgi:hypothetical protein